MYICVNQSKNTDESPRMAADPKVQKSIEALLGSGMKYIIPDPLELLVAK